MSEKITSENLEKVVEANKLICRQIDECVSATYRNFPSQNISPAVYAFQILEQYNYIQFPKKNSYWSGGIFVRDGKKTPVINTNLPRANQYLTAWHEIYHLKFDDVSFDMQIDENNYLEERKAEYYASKMMIGNVSDYYNSIGDESFENKIFLCMNRYQTTYKSILISLFENACNNNNDILKKEIKENFDKRFDNLPERFQNLGLDDSLVLPSNTIRLGKIQKNILKQINEHPEESFHKDNLDFYNATVEKIRQSITGK